MLPSSRQPLHKIKLKVVDFESEEEAQSFVNYVAILGDDGESATCLVAVHARMGDRDRRQAGDLCMFSRKHHPFKFYQPQK